jgi:acyl-CoA reductase-like NAD-dependent aldehyde dehydrogenase
MRSPDLDFSTYDAGASRATGGTTKEASKAPIPALSSDRVCAMPTQRPLLLAGASVWTAHPAHVVAPYDGRIVAHVARAGFAEAEQAAAAAAEAFERTRAVPSRRRAAVLRRAAEAVRDSRDGLVALLRDEGGKPVRYGRDEVTRAERVLQRCADEADRLDGAVLPDAPALPVYLRRCVPRGPVLAVGADHAPLLTACQRIGAALAAGCPIVLLPATAPSVALALGDILLRAGLCSDELRGALSVLPASADVVDALVADARFASLALTARGRWAARARAGRRHVRVDPGARANAIVTRDADLDVAIPRLAEGAYAHAGQSSAGVQRVLVQEELLSEVRDRLAAEAEAVAHGDPSREDVVCGPLIDAHRMTRLRAWMAGAATHGLRRVAGGEWLGAQVVRPSVYEVSDTREPPPVSGPLVLLQPYRTLDSALAVLGAAGPASATALFTRSRCTLWHAFDRLDAGMLVHNDYPGRRVPPEDSDEADGRAALPGPRALIEGLMEVRTVVWG